MKTLQVKLLTIFLLSASLTYSQTHTSTVSVDRADEVLFKLQDSGGDYTGFWTMNDGLGNMSIKLGINEDGNYTVTNDGASEILWGAHNVNGYISLNAARKGTAANSVSYGISLIVNSEGDAIEVGAPNNATGGMSGHKIANALGDLFTDKLTNRSSSGLDIDLGSAAGDLSIYDAAGTEFILGDQNSGVNSGIVLRTTSNPSSGQPLFSVESSGYSERLRVEHSGAVYTTNFLEVDNTGKSYIKGSLAVSGTSVPSGYKLAVEGKAIMEEVKVELSGSWPDYVFESDYQLPSLQSIEQYIKSEKHLPEVPSAKEIEANGLQLGEMNVLLLKKIEELTLYTINQEAKIRKLEEGQEPNAKSLQGKIEELILYTIEQQKEIEKLHARIDQVESIEPMAKAKSQEPLKAPNKAEN